MVTGSYTVTHRLARVVACDHAYFPKSARKRLGKTEREFWEIVLSWSEADADLLDWVIGDDNVDVESTRKVFKGKFRWP